MILGFFTGAGDYEIVLFLLVVLILAGVAYLCFKRG